MNKEEGMNSRKWLAGVAVGALALGMGCAGKPPVIGSEKIIERSEGSTPDWVLTPFEEKKDTMYLSGVVKGVADYSLGLRQAKAEGLKNLVEQVKTRARTQFTEATRGSNMSPNDLGRFVEDGIAFTSDNLEVSGIAPKKYYYEKIERVTATGVQYLYNCFALLQLPVRDYKEARDRALNKLADEARKKQDKVAEQTAQDLLKKLEAQ